MDHDVIDSLHDNVYYHGTFCWAAEEILRRGFLTRITLDEDLTYRPGGILGYGVYVTNDFATALWYRRGGVVLRLRLARGTRIVTCGSTPDPRLIASLKREFGKDIVRQPPWKVLPRNKQLKRHEAIALVQYHYDRWNALSRRTEGRREHAHWQLMLQLRPILARYGIDGFGEPANHNGLVVFGADRVIPIGLVMPEQVDAATLQRARENPGAREVDDWLRFCRTPWFRELAAEVISHAARNQSSSMPR